MNQAENERDAEHLQEVKRGLEKEVDVLNPTLSSSDRVGAGFVFVNPMELIEVKESAHVESQAKIRVIARGIRRIFRKRKL